VGVHKVYPILESFSSLLMSLKMPIGSELIYNNQYIAVGVDKINRTLVMQRFGAAYIAQKIVESFRRGIEFSVRDIF